MGWIKRHWRSALKWTIRGLRLYGEWMEPELPKAAQAAVALVDSLPSRGGKLAGRMKSSRAERILRRQFPDLPVRDLRLALELAVQDSKHG